MPSPVIRKVADRDATIEFVNEAAWHGFAAVYVAPDVAALFGATTSTRIPVVAERFVVAGRALAMPAPVPDFESA